MKHTLTALVLGISLLFASGGLLSAQDISEGLKSYDKGDFLTARIEWKLLAENGNAKAQFNLALLYDNGLGGIEDNKEAAKWYRKSATQGLAEAQFSLGVMYETGEGVIKSTKEAVAWYRKAAEQGHAKALFNLRLIIDDINNFDENFIDASIKNLPI